MKLSVIIPMYNEEAIAEKSLQTLTAYLSDYVRAAADEAFFTEYELIAVNDGSSDRTAELLQKAAESDPHIVAAGYPENRGKGCAVRTGMLVADGDLRIFTDCDLAYGTEVLGRMAEHYLSTRSDLILGSRNLEKEGHEGYSFFRKVMSKAYFRLIRQMTGFSHSDSQSGCKGFSAAAAEAVFPLCETDGFAFDLEAIFLSEKLGFSVSEIPVRILQNRESGSKVHPVRDAWGMLSDIRRIRRRIQAMGIPKQAPKP